MNPYREYMSKSSGLIRAKFLSPSPMTPGDGVKLNHLMNRYVRMKSKAMGLPEARVTSFTLGHNRAGGYKDISWPSSNGMGFRVQSDVHHSNNGVEALGGFQEKGLSGYTGYAQVESDHRGKGYGKGFAQLTDDLMAGLGSRRMQTNAAVPASKHYRAAMGYKVPDYLPPNADVMFKEVLETPAIARDRARFA